MHFRRLVMRKHRRIASMLLGGKNMKKLLISAAITGTAGSKELSPYIPITAEGSQRPRSRA